MKHFCCTWRVFIVNVPFFSNDIKKNSNGTLITNLIQAHRNYFLEHQLDRMCMQHKGFNLWYTISGNDVLLPGETYCCKNEHPGNFLCAVIFDIWTSDRCSWRIHHPNDYHLVKYLLHIDMMLVVFSCVSSYTK